MIITSIKPQKYHFYKEYAAIISFMPNLKLHDIIVIYKIDSKSIYTIDYSPLVPDNIDVLKDLFTGKNVPANIRIRKLKSWDLDKWYQTKPISIDDIYDSNLRKHLLTIQNKWNNNKKEMNLYKHNCKHFSHFVVNYLFTLDSFFKERL
jgi:hypothetical protein